MREDPTGADAEERYRGVRDGEALEVLANGLVLIRRKKHEPISLTGLTRQEIVEATSKRSGSKFLDDWTLTRYVQWLRRQIDLLDWTQDTGPTTTVVHFDVQIGISRGIYARKVRLRSDGRYVHAYPEE
jgi:hypothetical protein